MPPATGSPSRRRALRRCRSRGSWPGTGAHRGRGRPGRIEVHDRITAEHGFEPITIQDHPVRCLGDPPFTVGPLCEAIAERDRTAVRDRERTGLVDGRLGGDRQCHVVLGGTGQGAIADVDEHGRRRLPHITDFGREVLPRRGPVVARPEPGGDEPLDDLLRRGPRRRRVGNGPRSPEARPPRRRVDRR